LCLLADGEIALTGGAMAQTPSLQPLGG